MSTMISGWMVQVAYQRIVTDFTYVYFDIPFSLLDTSLYWAIGSVIIFASIFFAIWRYSVLKGAQALAAHDKKRYDDQWIKFKLSNGGSLEVYAANIHKALSEATTTNIIREPKQTKKRIAKLSDLYMLADKVHPWFLLLVKRWHGVVNESPRREAQERMTFSPKQCTLKAVERSIQKIHRVYGGKLTRLVDVVRACIVCYDLSEVLVVLNAVKASTTGDHPEVELVRWKNGYSDGTSNGAKQRGGYRDVQLILRTTGCEDCPFFLVELQICLMGFFLLKMENEIPNPSDSRHESVVEGVSERQRSRSRSRSQSQSQSRSQSQSQAKKVFNDDVHVENGAFELDTIKPMNERSEQAETVNRVFARKAGEKNRSRDATDIDDERR